MSYKVKDVPSPRDIIVGLDPERDAALIAARAAVVTAKASHDRAKADVSAAVRRVDQVTGDVAAGRAAVTDLEGALRRRDACALVVPGYQQGAVDAEAALQAALARANAAVIAEAVRRRDRLQDIADQVTPVLDALREAEDALDNLVVPLGARDGVPPVVWPQSNEDAGAFHRARLPAAHAPKASA